MGLSLAGSYWLALGRIVAFLGLLWIVLPSGAPADAQQAASKTRSFKYLVVGADNRVSTSKVQFALWTVALAYALLVIAFHRFELPPGNLDPRYLLLLGFPAGAAVSAKAITAQKTANMKVTKTKAPKGSLADIVTDEAGEIDLGDTQYFLFNPVALTAFLIAFFHHPTTLPMLSDTSVALTSGSAAAYVAKKAATSDTPVTISAVTPQKGTPGCDLQTYGTNLCGGPQSTADPSVTVGGVVANIKGSAVDSQITVTVSSDLVASAEELPVQIVTSTGQTAVLKKAFVVT